MNNIILRVTVRCMKQNKKRTALTFLGITLMVMLMTCVFIGKDTGLGYLTKLGEQKNGRYHVVLYDAGSEDIDNFSRLSYVANTAVSYDLDNIVFQKSVNSERPVLFVKAYSDKNFDWMNIKLCEGRLPENSGEIVISRAALLDGADIKIGDTVSGEFFKRTLQSTGFDGASETVLPYYGLTLKVGDEPVTVGQDMCLWEGNESILEQRVYSGASAQYTVVGFIESPNYEAQSAAGYIALTRTDKNTQPDRVNLTMLLDL